jgi:hypothetical protein
MRKQRQLEVEGSNILRNISFQDLKVPSGAFLISSILSYFVYKELVSILFNKKITTFNYFIDI